MALVPDRVVVEDVKVGRMRAVALILWTKM